MKTNKFLTTALSCAFALSVAAGTAAAGPHGHGGPWGPGPGPGPYGPPPPHRHWGGPWGPWWGGVSAVVVYNEETSSPRVRQTEPSRFSVHGIRPGVSTATELERAFGKPDDIEATTSSASYRTTVYTYTYKKLDMTAVVLPDDSIHGISIGSASPLKIDVGLGIGNTVVHIANSYGDAVNQLVLPIRYVGDDRGRYQYVLPIYNTHDATAINYYTIDDVIQHINITHVFPTVNHPLFFPEDSAKKAKLIEKLIDRSKRAMSDKKFVLAGCYIDNAFEFADKADIRPYQARAALYTEKGKYKKAQKELLKAQKIAPDNQELKDGILRLQGKLDEKK